ncbi:MMPL family transporter [Dermatophilaceae bacterium Soc4.6]
MTHQRPEGTSPSPSTTVAPPGRLERFGALVARRPRAVLALFLAALAVAGVLGAGLFPRLQSAGFDDADAESGRASTVLGARFHVHQPILVLAVDTPAGVDSAAGSAAATALVREVGRSSGVTDVTSYWTSGRPGALRSTDGRMGEVVVGVGAADDTTRAEVGARVTALVEQLDARDPLLTVAIGGAEAVNQAINDSITGDLARAESIAIPLTFVLLLLVFGSLVSAGLPLVVALGSIVGSFFLVWVISLTTDVSIFALNLITGLGLGLGIDYALLVVTRFREELALVDDPSRDGVRAAVARTVATAGRTVIFSGATVTVVLASMMFFRQYFLRSFGYAGVAATAMAVLAAITALPAALSLLGTRIDRLRVRGRDLAPRDDGAWARVAGAVMRRPVPVLFAVITLLGVLASPVLGVSFTQTDQRALPADHPVAVTSATLATRFAGQQGSPVDVVLPGMASRATDVRQYAETLSRLPHVVTVTTPTDVVASGAVVAPNPDPRSWAAGPDARLAVVSDVEPVTNAGRDLVASIRSTAPPVPDRLVGGTAAQFTDSQSAIADRGRWALAWIALATLVLLFLFTGSVLIPVKAVLLNVLSLTATLGVLVWVFQEGHLQWLVGDFTVTGGVDTSMAVLVAVTAFALSMDYEVFLIARIAEEHHRGSDTQRSVTLGLQRSGRIITAAAVLLAVVFATFVTSGVTNIKQLGFGVAFAILLDATVVRGLLVPALMRLLGEANWWAPRWLTRVHGRLGLREH